MKAFVFVPGEIDHHNAQVTLTLVMVACVLWCEDAPRFAVAAGIAGGVLLGVGLEAAALLVAVAGALAMLVVYDARWSAPVRLRSCWRRYLPRRLRLCENA